MNSGPTGALGGLLRVSPQRWSLSFAALLAASAAPLATGIASGSLSLPAFVVIVALAALAVARPATHSALAVFVAAIWHWLASVDDSSSPWVLLLAVSSFVFHALVALMATTGPTATIDPVTLHRWLRRSIGVVAAIGATWLAVTALDQRSTPGSVELTALALVAAAALSAGLRSALPRSTD